MRRHAFLALSMPDPSSTSSADAEMAARRRAAQVPTSPADHVHRRLPRLFSGIVPGCNEDNEDTTSDDDSTGSPEDREERRANFLGRVQSYSQLMHAHTKFQLNSPTTSTLPSYTRTMHAFTLNQLASHKTTTKSESTSPRIGVSGRQIMLPAKICTELTKLTLDEAPRNSSNTPDSAHLAVEGIDFRSARRRSKTEPIPRDFASSVLSRDFAS